MQTIWKCAQTQLHTIFVGTPAVIHSQSLLTQTLTKGLKPKPNSNLDPRPKSDPSNTHYIHIPRILNCYGCYGRSVKLP